jgi:DedD protein
MVLDPEPRAVPENIPIDIPSERTPFTPRLALPPMPAPESAPPAERAAPDAQAPVKGETSNARAEADKARAALEGKAAEALPAPVKGGKFAVQVAAPANEKAARELSDRLKNGGFAAFTEKVETRDGARYRVRIGPFASRDDAELVRARLKTAGVNGNLVTQ